MHAPLPDRRIRFGPFELDTRTDELWKHGRRIRVRDQPIQILRALLDRPGDVVTREALRERLWSADTFVDFDRGLNSAVRRLRDALGDSADRPKFVETLPRLGYRFIGTIEADAAVVMAAPAVVEGPAATTPAISAPPAYEPPPEAIVVPPASRAWPRWLVAATMLLLTIALSTLASKHGVSALRASRSAGWSEPTGLTYDDGLQTNPSFSRDGTSIVFAAGDATHNFRIYTQRLDEDGKTAGTPVPVTRSAANDSQPDWSPKGDLIAFRRSEGDTGGIFVVPATGGVARPLTDFGYLPQWSPDGQRILFTNMLVNHLDDKFWIVTSGQDPQPLTFERASGGAFGWGPGSHHIVALSAFRFPFGVNLASLNIETQQPTSWAFAAPVLERFREHALVVPRERLAWSEDERAIYFIGESRGQRGVWRIGVDATAHRVVAGPTRIFSAQGNAHTFTLARDGGRIAFGATRPAQLWAYDLDDAGRLRPDSATAVSREAVYAESPALSPDGGQLVSLQTQPGSRHQTNLVLRDMTAATNSERILRTIDDIRENIAFPRWNAAGTRLSYGDYVSDTNTIRDQVRLLDPATQRGGEALTSPRPANGLVANLPGNWTPDDRAVVASSRRYVEGRDSIVLLPLDESPHADLAPTIVTSNGRGNIYQVMVSPDGRWIVFRATLSRRPQIAIVSTSARGSDEASWITAVAKTGWNVDKPRWSPSSDRIYFSVTAGGPLSLWSIGFDSARGQVAGEPRSELIRTSPAFHLLPDIREFDLAVGGGRLVVPVVRPTGGIWISERVR